MSEYDEMTDPAFSAIGLAAEPVAPPSGLREKILAAAAPVVPLPAMPAVRRRVPLPLAAAALVLITIAAFVLGQELRGGGAPGPATFAMNGHGVLQGAVAKVTDLRTDKIAVVEFNGMPAPPAGKVYELWLITADGRADAAGVFVPDSSGHTVVVVDHTLAGYSVMAVTVENGPAGVTSPTQQPAMTGNIQ